jgi:GAF domain-containing protein
MIGVEVVGLIYVDRAEPYRCPERRLRTLQALAEQAGVAWQQARLYHELETQYQKIKALDQAKLDFIQIASHELRTPWRWCRATPPC